MASLLKGDFIPIFPFFGIILKVYFKLLIAFSIFSSSQNSRSNKAILPALSVSIASAVFFRCRVEYVIT